MRFRQEPEANRTDDRDEQEEKHCAHRISTFAGISISRRFLRSRATYRVPSWQIPVIPELLNAPLQISTPAGISISRRLLQEEKAELSMRFRQEPEANRTDDSEEQEEKQDPHRISTFAGISISRRLLQEEKA